MAAGSLDLNLAYEIDDLVSSSDPFRSWTKIQQRVVLDGQGTLNRHTVPKDLLLPSFANGTLSASGDAAYPEAEVSFDFQQISNARQPLELQSGPLDLPNVGIVHGPALQSADSYSLEAGDILSFDWRGMAGTGDYDVMTYIVDESTGHSEILMNETGKGGVQPDDVRQVKKEKHGHHGPGQGAGPFGGTVAQFRLERKFWRNRILPHGALLQLALC